MHMQTLDGRAQHQLNLQFVRFDGPILLERWKS